MSNRKNGIINMKTIINPSKKDWASILTRPTKTVEDIEETVNQIFNDVQKNKDEAVTKYTKLYDGVVVKNMIVSEEEIKEASTLIPEKLKDAIQLAKKNIHKFHEAQQTSKVFVETISGVSCWQEKRPIQKVGIVYSWRNSPFVFNSFNVSCSCTNCRL